MDVVVVVIARPDKSEGQARTQQQRRYSYVFMKAGGVIRSQRDAVVFTEQIACTLNNSEECALKKRSYFLFICLFFYCILFFILLIF